MADALSRLDKIDNLNNDDFSKIVKGQTSPDYVEMLVLIKNWLLNNFRLSLAKFEKFIREVIIEIANNKENLDVTKLFDDSM